MMGDHHPVHHTEPFQDFGALFLRHEHEAFLRGEPIVVIQDNHQFIAKFFCFSHQAHMPHMQGVKPARDNNYFSFLFYAL